MSGTEMTGFLLETTTKQTGFEEGVLLPQSCDDAVDTEWLTNQLCSLETEALSEETIAIETTF